MSHRYTLRQVSVEVGVPVEDVFTVAEIELIEPEEYDPESGTVSEDGRKALLVHFHGGEDEAR